MTRLGTTAVALGLWAMFNLSSLALGAEPLVAVEEKADCVVFQTQWYRAELDRATGLLRSVKPKWSAEDEVVMMPGSIKDAAGTQHTSSKPNITFPHRSPFYCMVSCEMTTALGKHTRIYEFLDSPAIYVTDYMDLKAHTALKSMRIPFAVKNASSARADGTGKPVALTGGGGEFFAKPLFWEHGTGKSKRSVWRAISAKATSFSVASFPSVKEFMSFNDLGKPRIVVVDKAPPELEVRAIFDPARKLKGTVAMTCLLVVEQRGKERFLGGLPRASVTWPGKLLRMFWAGKGYDNTPHTRNPVILRMGFNWHTYSSRINDVVSDYEKDRTRTLYHDLIVRQTYNRLELLAAGGGIYFPPVTGRYKGREHFPGTLYPIVGITREYHDRFPKETRRLCSLFGGTKGIYRPDPTYNVTGKATPDTLVWEVADGIWLAKDTDTAPKISTLAWNYHCTRTIWAEKMKDVARLVGDADEEREWEGIWTRMVNGFLYYLPVMVTKRNPKYVHVMDGAFACGDHGPKGRVCHPLPPYWNGDFVYDARTNRVYRHYAFILTEFIANLANRYGVQVATIPLTDKVMRHYKPPRKLEAPESAWKGIPPVRGQREKAPSVKVLFPNGGETVSGTADIKWEAKDPNNKPLRYRIAYSADRGETWTHLAIGWKKTTYPWRTNWDFGPYSKHLWGIRDGNKYLVRIEADNGEATAIAVSGAPFKVDNPTVKITSPAQGAVVKGKVKLAWECDRAARGLGCTVALFHPKFLAPKIDDVLLGNAKGAREFEWDTTKVKNGTYYILVAAGEGEITKNLDFRLLAPTFESKLILASDYLEVKVEN